MARTEAKRKADQRYKRTHEKTLACGVNLDEYARFKAYAERRGKTISGVLLEYVRRCISDAEQVTEPEQLDFTLTDNLE